MQVSSVKELLARCQQLAGAEGADAGKLGSLGQAHAKLQTMMKQLSELNDTYGAEMQANLLTCKDKNVAIHKQLLRTFIKFERLINLESKVAASGIAGPSHANISMTDTQRRDRLLAAQRRVLERIHEAKRGHAGTPGMMLYRDGTWQRDEECKDDLSVKNDGGLLLRLSDLQGKLQNTIALQERSDAQNYKFDDLKQGSLASTQASTREEEIEDERDLKQIFKVLRK